MSEFQLIANYFNQPSLTSVGEIPAEIGIGDDCALLSIPEQQRLAVSIDTLVADVHFPAEAAAEQIGYRALAVSVSDLAAMGATPSWFTLALTLPEANEYWLAEFAKGLSLAASQFGIRLIGGDTTKGPLTISIQVQGMVSARHAMLRSNAKVGDHIYVSGTLGDAAAALDYVIPQPTLAAANENSSVAYLYQRYFQPEPRLALGKQLAALGVNCAIDISDGLLADLGHILSASAKVGPCLGAQIDLTDLPISKALMSHTDKARATSLALTGGDDYELCFTVPADLIQQLSPLIEAGEITLIGHITAQPGIVDNLGQPVMVACSGYQHF
ncbi:thiamine-phosphate kinase [Endozoicomonas sp. SM1973]|uniref:Thiamine-monophosphate kinase n=1 Tax=Spartinivicinus marinus TaxID=2994442 RepID=A0A853IJQ3_9GAMM|nr:thiamine-phosphate kinase [Spartinivicinus marinus]MCX4025976.1 thiamine-phosphate kinase [Spartinivicinus marinus]NYZ67876.1 thiamine-phosphate kinase [Spartinivicinus marinus]